MSVVEVRLPRHQARAEPRRDGVRVRAVRAVAVRGPERVDAGRVLGDERDGRARGPRLALAREQLRDHAVVVAQYRPAKKQKTA